MKTYLNEIKGQLNSTDEELFKSMKHVFKEMRREREASLFKLKNMIINGSLPLSLVFVTSILSPRHVRWSLLICNVTILWFLCAVYFNNTKDPLVVPDFNKEASSLAMNELWISFIAPLGSMVLMFVISCFLKMPNNHFINVVTLRQLEIAVIEYKKEQTMRFFMGYLVVACIMGYIFWYIVQFTATYGWKVSWVWYYTGILAIFMQFAIYDPIIATLHWIAYHRKKKWGRKCQKCRSMSQGFNETFDLSDGEEEERRRKEQEDKERRKESRREAKRAKKLGKSKAKVSLFGEGDAVSVAASVAASVAPSEMPPPKIEEELKEGEEHPHYSGSDSHNKGKSSGHETAEDALNGGSSSGNHSDSKNMLGEKTKKKKRKQD